MHTNEEDREEEQTHKHTTTNYKSSAPHVSVLVAAKPPIKVDGGLRKARQQRAGEPPNTPPPIKSKTKGAQTCPLLDMTEGAVGLDALRAKAAEGAVTIRDAQHLVL